MRMVAMGAEGGLSTGFSVAFCWAYSTSNLGLQTPPCFHSSCVSRYVCTTIRIRMKASDIWLCSQTSSPWHYAYLRKLAIPYHVQWYPSDRSLGSLTGPVAA